MLTKIASLRLLISEMFSADAFSLSDGTR